MSKRRTFSPEFKARVVLDMLIGGKSLAQTCREYKVKDSVLSRWKADFLKHLQRVFETGIARDDRDERIEELERMIGRLTMELEMAKKVSRHLR